MSHVDFNALIETQADSHYDAVAALYDQMITGTLSAKLDIQHTDGTDVITQGFAMVDAIDGLSGNVTKGAVNAAAVLYALEQRGEDGCDWGTLRDTICAHPEFAKRNTSKSGTFAINAFKRAVGLGMVALYGTKEQRKACRHGNVALIMGAESTWQGKVLTEKGFKAAYEFAKGDVAKQNAKEADKKDKAARGKSDAGKEASAGASVTAKQLETAKAENKALSQAAQSSVNAMQQVKQVAVAALATLRNESLTDEMARAKATEVLADLLDATQPEPVAIAAE